MHYYMIFFVIPTDIWFCDILPLSEASAWSLFIDIAAIQMTFIDLALVQLSASVSGARTEMRQVKPVSVYPM